MALKVTKTKVWVAAIKDQPGSLAECLESLAAAGANLECIIARRVNGQPDIGAAFVTPLRGRKVQTAAAQLGFHTTECISTLKVEGADLPGLGAKIARAVGAVGVSMRGVTATVIGRKFVCYLGFDCEADADTAARVLRRIK